MMNELNECKASVDNISGLDDTPAIGTSELKAEFDKAGREIKKYLNETLIPHVNDEIIKGIEDANTSIKTLETTINDNKNDLNKVIPKVYVNSTDTESVRGYPEIRFVKNTAPNTTNYGAKLPVGSIVFVYEG